MLNILINEEIPSKNKGEAAILLGFIESLKLAKLDKIKIRMLSFDIKNNKFKNQGIELISYVENIDKKSKFSVLVSGFVFFIEFFLVSFFYIFLKKKVLKIFKKKIWKIYLDSNVFICGHDGLIEGMENSENKFNKKITYLFTFLQILILKLFLKKKVCILGASIGPYNPKLLEILAKISLKKVDLITVRDKNSFDYLKSLGISKNIFKCADFAFLMKNSNKIDKKIRNFKAKSLLIGLTVSKGFHVFLGNNDHSYDKYIRLKAKIIDYLVSKYKAKIVFLPHGIKKGKDDRIVAHDIFDNIKGKSSFLVLEKDYRPEDLKSITSMCDIFIGERTHSNIAALSSNIPSLIISEPGSYRNSMFKELIGEKYILEIDKAEYKQYCRKIDQLIKNRFKIKNRLKIVNKIFIKKAKENALLLINLFYGSKKRYQ